MIVSRSDHQCPGRLSAVRGMPPLMPHVGLASTGSAGLPHHPKQYERWLDVSS